jgi:hypothetical protein
MTAATVQFRQTEDHYAVSFRYNPALVEAVKNVVPPASRRWLPAQKHWLVDLFWADELAEVLREAGYKVIGFEVHQQLTAWAVSLFQAVGEDRAPAVHRALTTVLHPDRPTGSAELQQQLNDGRRQVEERRAEMPHNTPVVEYASTSSGDMFMRAIAEIADEKVRQLAAQTGLSVSHVRQLKRENRLHTLYDSDGQVMTKVERRGRISGREAQRQLERMREPLSGVEARRLTMAMEAKRTRSGAEALALTEAAYRPGHVWFIPTLKCDMDDRWW